MLLLKNAKVIDGKSDKPLENYSILIENNKIKKIVPSDQMTENETDDIKTIDCSERTIMPGLMDIHDHLIYRHHYNAYSMDLMKSIEEATMDALINARELLNYGITTIRDVGTRGNISMVVRDFIESGEFPGPRVYPCGRIISTKGGLADYHPSHIFAQHDYPYRNGELILGADEARSAVRKMLKDGAEWIKTEASGTSNNPFCPAERNTLSFEELEAIVNQAKQNHVYVACHAESNEAIKKASKAGVRSVEHGVYLDDEAIELMLANDVFLVPTLANYWNAMEKGKAAGRPQKAIDNHLRIHEFHIRSVQKAIEANLCIVAGSDSGAVYFPQGGVREEIVRFVEIGMSPMDAIKTATYNAARCLDIEETVGTLEEGKQADLLILEQNPLENISIIKETENVVTVIKNGKIVRNNACSI